MLRPNKLMGWLANIRSKAKDGDQQAHIGLHPGRMIDKLPVP
jgi:hypothetical protein